MILKGIRILVTRPAHQAEHLCRLIEAQGGQAIRLPTIEIVEVADQNPLLACRAQLEALDFAIFISANAVEKALPVLLAQRSLPASLQIIAVGRRTAEVLSQWPLTAHCPAPPFNSEQVLAMPQLQEILGKQIVIFRGEGGRELLAETLQQRGAIVNYVNVYRRIQPRRRPLESDQIDMIVVTSGDGLQNLLTMFEGQKWVRYTPLVVMSQRIREQAWQLGIQAPMWVAPMANDEGLMAAILEAAEKIVIK